MLAIQEDVLALVARLVRIVLHVLDQKDLFDRLEKMHIGAPSPLEAEVAHRIWTYQILQRLEQQWESRFKINTIGSEHDIWKMWDGFRSGLAPIVDTGFDSLLEMIERNVPLH